ncbi:MAG: trypsin-like peptidase domain-containing protein [Candidatus Promineifilaceae bacterium]|nr:trypsin-like peptidase domain-containing protein [Candidatus Promineifilaceae bacterium]
MNKRFPLLFLVATLVVVGLACNALLPTVETQHPESVTIDQDEIVNRAVATVEARMAETEIETSMPTTEETAVAPDLEQALVSIYRNVNPAVVYIITEHETADLGSGSGFVYDDQGHIVTNNHVVTAGDAFEVVFANGSRRRATLVGTDVDSDLAVIKVGELPAGISPVPLGEFDDVQVGQFAVAIGNPFEQQGSISLGIVSALGRSLRSQRPTEDLGFFSLPEVIQTDAPINPGNSGGPLLNIQGEVIGVNSAIRSVTGFNSGVGFAIPVAAVRRVVPALIVEGTYTYPYLGISTPPFEIDLDTWEDLNLGGYQGVYVTRVTEGGPAEEAGIIPMPDNSPEELEPGGDLIIGIDDQEVREFHDLISYLVFETEVGQTVDLTIVRDGEEMTVPITLGARP